MGTFVAPAALAYRGSQVYRGSHLRAFHSAVIGSVNDLQYGAPTVMPGNRVFIGPLGDEVRQEDIRKFFRHVGTVKLIIRKRGFAFADFACSRDATRAIRHNDGKSLSGRRVRVEMAYELERTGKRKREQGYTSSLSGDSPNGTHFRECVHSMHNLPRKSNYRVKVDNIPSDFTWKELKNLFGLVSEVVYADVCRKYEMGFVEFSSSDGMEKAISHLNGYVLKGRSISICPLKKVGRKQSPSSDVAE